MVVIIVKTKGPKFDKVPNIHNCPAAEHTDNITQSIAKVGYSNIKVREYMKPFCCSRDTDRNKQENKLTAHIIWMGDMLYCLKSPPCQFDVKLSNTR